jgi:hypothetical protein
VIGRLTTCGVDRVEIGGYVVERGKNLELTEQEIKPLLKTARANPNLSVELLDEYTGEGIDLPADSAPPPESRFEIVPLSTIRKLSE